jgi:hypothetical protein
VPYYLNFTLATNQLQGSGDISQVANIIPNTVIPGAGVVDTSSTTQFVSDANLVSGTVSNITSVDPSFIQSSTDMISQDIRDFLSKPVILTSGVFSTSDTFSTFPEYITPGDILNVNNLMFDKVKGYLGFRATTVLRLVVNASRFQQGRYNLQLLPIGGGHVAATGPSRHRVNAVQNTLVQRTQLPHVELDLACDTEAILKYPFVSATNFYPFSSLTNATSYGSVGLIKIYPYAALEAGSGSTTCAFTLWAHFEDIELIGAAVPQSGRAFSTKSRKKSETEVEQDSNNIGPISSTLMKVSNAANVFTKVPLLSTYASMTSWYAELLASAASAFGWCKPINLENSTRVTQNYLPYTANVDGPDNSFPLSFSYKNQVGKAQGFSGTDLDEMDFKFLCTIPTYYAQATWLPNQAAGTSLVSVDVRPLGALVTRLITARTITDAAPYQFVARMFNQWRGSLVYKLKLVKTEFHSGRLAVSFSPSDGHVISPSVPTLTNTSFLHRQIIDIRECNEFTFEVPYISSSPFMKYTNSIGRFTVHVLDPLVAPSTVPQAIQIIVETCMGSDAEFAVPRKFNVNTIYGLTPQSGDPFSSNLEANVCSNYRGLIGSSKPTSNECVNSLYCVGESISSLRTLAKLPSIVTFTAAPTAAAFLNILPFSIPLWIYNSTPAYIDGVTNADTYSLIAQLYLFGRGGVRLKYIDNTAVTNADAFVVYLGSAPSGVLLTTGFNYNTVDGNSSATALRVGLPTMHYRAGYSGEVQIPQYMEFHSRLVTDTMLYTGQAYPTGTTSINPDTWVSRTTVPPTTTATSVMRSGSDDCNFGVFLAVPPIFSF